MAWTQADINTLKAAIASGVQSVNYAGPPSREVVYQSIPDMLTALAAMQQEVTAAASTTSTSYRVASTRKGF